MRLIHPPRPTLVAWAVSLLLILMLPVAASAAGPGRLTRAAIPGMPRGSMLADVIAGGPGFIAVGHRIDQSDGATSAQIWTSPDGTGWTQVALTGDAAVGQIRGIAAVDGGFIAVGGRCCSDQGLVWRSSDGLTWTVEPDVAGMADAALFAAAQLPDGAVVAVGCAAVMECGGGLAWRSDDGGTTWVGPVTLPGLLLDVVATSFGAVAVGTTEAYEGAPMAATSADGIGWTGTVLPGPQGTLSAALATGGGVLALGSSQRSLGAPPRSLVALTEGTAWGSVEAGRMRGTSFLAGVRAADAGASRPAMILAGGWTVAAGGATRPGAWWSTDAATWTSIAIGASRGQVMGMAVGVDGTLVAVGWVGRDDTSGAVWTAALAG